MCMSFLLVQRVRERPLGDAGGYPSSSRVGASGARGFEGFRSRNVASSDLCGGHQLGWRAKRRAGGREDEPGGKWLRRSTAKTAITWSQAWARPVSGNATKGSARARTAQVQRRMQSVE